MSIEKLIWFKQFCSAASNSEQMKIGGPTLEEGVHHIGKRELRKLIKNHTAGAVVELRNTTWGQQPCSNIFFLKNFELFQNWWCFAVVCVNAYFSNCIGGESNTYNALRKHIKFWYNKHVQSREITTSSSFTIQQTGWNKNTSFTNNGDTHISRKNI